VQLVADGAQEPDQDATTAWIRRSPSRMSYCSKDLPEQYITVLCCTVLHCAIWALRTLTGLQLNGVSHVSGSLLFLFVASNFQY